MGITTRTGAALLAAALAGAATSLMAQTPDLPLFTNPRYATGFRIHADVGRPTDRDSQVGDETVYHVGASFVLGPVGLNAFAGARRDTYRNLQLCQTNAAACDPQSKATVSALAQVRILGGGRAAHSVAVFGSASYDITAYDASGLTALEAAALGIDTTRNIRIPVGLAVGYHVPLGVASLNLWGAPRMVVNPRVDRIDDCCNVRWAVGADIPVLRLFSVRAAYDSGRENGVTRSMWGAGASVGVGGMR